MHKCAATGASSQGHGRIKSRSQCVRAATRFGRRSKRVQGGRAVGVLSGCDDVPGAPWFARAEGAWIGPPANVRC